MNSKQLDTILKKHRDWLDGKKGGLRANLQGADLKGAFLQGADLQGAYLQGAYLQGADLQGAYLQEADLDFSCWPLWCGSMNVKIDNRLLYQLLAHICAVDCDTPEFKKIRKYLMPYAKQSHRARELELL